MSMVLMLTAVSQAQAERLRAGEITTDDLVTPSAVSHSGKGDVTYLGCGCVLTLVAAVLAMLTWLAFGTQAMLAVFVVGELWAVWYAWRFYRMTHRRSRIESVDPERLIADDACLGLYCWHGIHYLLTGIAWEGDAPLDFLLHGGTELRWREHGAERLMSPHDVSATSTALSRVTVDELVSRYDAASMNRLEIHPQRWESEQERDALLQEYRGLKEFVEQAARSRSSVVAALT